MKSPLALLITVLCAFTLYTAFVVADSGYTGFLTLAWAEPWGGQLFVDLVIALSLFMIWMVGDARERGLPAWPYIGLVLTTGSIGALAYLVHRTAKSTRAASPSPA